MSVGTRNWNTYFTYINDTTTFVYRRIQLYPLPLIEGIYTTKCISKYFVIFRTLFCEICHEILRRTLALNYLNDQTMISAFWLTSFFNSHHGYILSSL